MYAIFDQKSGMYFSLLGSAHFTNNMEIIQKFDSEQDALICAEQHIDSNSAFDQVYDQVIKLEETNI